MPDKIKIDMDKALDMKEEGIKTMSQMAKILGCGVRTLQQRFQDLKEASTDESNEEILTENVKLAKQKQRYQDLNRIERKTFRDHVRKENAIAEYNKELLNVFTSYRLPEFVKGKKYAQIKQQNTSGIIHVSDAHFNELVNLPFNKYDFTIASKRFALFANRAKIYFKANKINNILIAITGDLMNSDRRLDEILAESTNRSKATFLAIAILRQFILDLSQDFRVTVSSVVGNESRVDPEIGWEENFASHNYDYTIFHTLALLFEKSKITFLDGGSVEQVIEVAGQNILLIHGNQIKKNNVEQDVQKIKGKYSSKGTRLDFILFGHLHSSRIGDTYARSSSIVGGNAYSDSALQLESRASQNIHIFNRNGTRDSIKIDLQNTDGIQGYTIIKELEKYNAKSINKAKKTVTVQRIA